jgi:hypothetical protein
LGGGGWGGGGVGQTRDDWQRPGIGIDEQQASGLPALQTLLQPPPTLVATLPALP